MREQFRFYRSYFDAIRRLKKAADRAAIYDAIADLILVTIEGLIVKTVLENKDKDDVEKIKRLLEGL